MKQQQPSRPNPLISHKQIPRIKMLEQMTLRLPIPIPQHHARTRRILLPDQGPLDLGPSILIPTLLPTPPTHARLSDRQSEQVEQRHDASTEPAVRVVLVDLVFGRCAEAVEEVEDVARVWLGGL